MFYPSLSHSCKFHPIPEPEHTVHIVPIHEPIHEPIHIPIHEPIHIPIHVPIHEPHVRPHHEPHAEPHHHHHGHHHHEHGYSASNSHVTNSQGPVSNLVKSTVSNKINGQPKTLITGQQMDKKAAATEAIIKAVKENF